MPQTTSTPHVVREFAGSEDGILLVIHAGAGNRGKHDSPERRAQAEQEDLRRALEAGYTLLEQGAPAQDAVCAAIRRHGGCPRVQRRTRRGPDQHGVWRRWMPV